MDAQHLPSCHVINQSLPPLPSLPKTYASHADQHEYHSMDFLLVAVSPKFLATFLSNHFLNCQTMTVNSLVSNLLRSRLTAHRMDLCLGLKRMHTVVYFQLFFLNEAQTMKNYLSFLHPTTLRARH